MAVSRSVEATEKIAQSVAQKIGQGGLICLFGDLGSGKTTFVKGLAESLGIKKFSIKSPTYVYIRAQENFYHIDLYRLEKIDQLLWREIHELLEKSGNIVVIEWADRIKEKLPCNRIEVHFRYMDENSREITIS